MSHCEAYECCGACEAFGQEPTDRYAKVVDRVACEVVGHDGKGETPRGYRWCLRCGHGQGDAWSRDIRDERAESAAARADAWTTIRIRPTTFPLSDFALSARMRVQ